MGAGMQRQIARVAALAGAFQVRNAFARVAKILPPQLHSSSRRSAWNSSVDRTARSRLLSTVPASGAASRSRAWWSPIGGVLPSPLFGLRPLDAFDRVVGDGVLLTEVFEQRGQRGQPVPDRRAAEFAPAHMNHYAWTSEDTVIQVHGQGPFAITYVNPADDPSK